MKNYAAIAAYFGVRVLSALVLLKLSAQFLSVGGFADFAQFLAFSSLLNMAVVGGAQNGLIRQAAAASDEELDAVQGAGLAILLAAVPLLGIPISLFSTAISRILTGSPDQWRTVIGLGLLALAAAPGQICWSLLSGRRRVAHSLGLQAFGILAGTGATSWFIVRGNVSLGALAFATGPVLASLATLPFLSQLKLSWRPTSLGLKHLLGYSGAIASTLGFSALILFALRWTYREHFGSVELGYWLAANRISDLSTQFLGLFLLQAFVPQFTAATDPFERRLLIFRYGALGAGLTGSALLIFVSAGRLLVHLFLSDAYLPAIPSIRLYMLGDFARSWVSLAMFAAFALGKPGRYAWIEISTVALMALVTLVLIRTNEVLAPQIAYASAFGVMALLIGATIFLRSHPRPRAELRVHGARQIPLRDSVLRLP